MSENKSNVRKILLQKQKNTTKKQSRKLRNEIKKKSYQKKSCVGMQKQIQQVAQKGSQNISKKCQDKRKKVKIVI